MSQANVLQQGRCQPAGASKDGASQLVPARTVPASGCVITFEAPGQSNASELSATVGFSGAEQSGLSAAGSLGSLLFLCLHLCAY